MRGERPREGRQDVEEVDEGLHVVEELVAAGPGEPGVDRDGIVLGVVLLEPLADVRVRGIEAVDDLGHDLPLDRIEDRDCVPEPSPLDRTTHGPATRRRGCEDRGARRAGEMGQECTPGHRPGDVRVELRLWLHRGVSTVPGTANRCVFTIWLATVSPARTWHVTHRFGGSVSMSGKCCARSPWQATQKLARWTAPRPRRWSS